MSVNYCLFKLSFDYLSIWSLTGPGLLLKNPTRHCYQEEMFKKAGWDVVTGPHPVAVKGRSTSHARIIYLLLFRAGVVFNYII